MALVDELKVKAKARSGENPGDAPILSVDSDLPSMRLLSTLLAYFGEEDTRAHVRLMVDGIEVGPLARVDLYGVVKPSMRTVGGSAHGALPGEPPFSLLKLCCRQPGCNAHLLVMRFDPLDPPRCPHHPGITMELCA